MAVGAMEAHGIAWSRTLVPSPAGDALRNLVAVGRTEPELTATTVPGATGDRRAGRANATLSTSQVGLAGAAPCPDSKLRFLSAGEVG